MRATRLLLFGCVLRTLPPPEPDFRSSHPIAFACWLTVKRATEASTKSRFQYRPEIRWPYAKLTTRIEDHKGKLRA